MRASASRTVFAVKLRFNSSQISPEERFAPGEVLDLENFTPKSPVATVAPTGRLKVVGHRWNKKILVVRFEEVTTRNQAEELRGSRLMFEVPEDEDDEGFYEQELVNLPVYLLVKVPEGENPVNNPKAGKPLGKVTGLQTMPRRIYCSLNLLPNTAVTRL